MSTNEEKRCDQEAERGGKVADSTGACKGDAEGSESVAPRVQVEGTEKRDEARGALQSESTLRAPPPGPGAEPPSLEELGNKPPTQSTPAPQKDEAPSTKNAPPSVATDELWTQLERVLGDADRVKFLRERCTWRPPASKSAVWALLIAKNAQLAPLASCALIKQDVIGGEELYGVMSTSTPQMAWIVGDRVEFVKDGPKEGVLFGLSHDSHTKQYAAWVSQAPPAVYAKIQLKQLEKRIGRVDVIELSHEWGLVARGLVAQPSSAPPAPLQQTPAPNTRGKRATRSETCV
jgi:hypothetical protein